YGEIWVYRPDSGGPGNWRFKGTKLVGGDSTVPQTHARYPTVGSDDDGNAYIGYQGYLVIPGDTVCDCGLFVRPANQDTWLDYGRCTFNGDSIEEYFLEFAHNAPIVRDSVIIGMIYQDESSYPEPLLLYFDYYKIQRPGIQELTSNLISKFKIEATPNPFRNQLIFSYPKSNGVSLEIFDVSGRMVYKGNLSGQSQSINWDGRNLAGSSVAAGVYFYKLCFDKGLAIGKVVKSK
ncbi:MAG: T9SS type A sorting domain-containing protein, partial [candidate division WOR-3 bacterium]|nr:T9SS type A sorting domain-containing protein [candidate division WOR-3 bacterium]